MKLARYHIANNVLLSSIILTFRDAATITLPTKPNFNPRKLPQSVSSLSVEFHVLLSKEEWFWDDSAKVYICFDHHLLGGFQCCYGPMGFAK